MGYTIKSETAPTEVSAQACCGLLEGKRAGGSGVGAPLGFLRAAVTPHLHPNEEAPPAKVCLSKG